MARKHLLTLAAIGFLAGGCVSQEKYNALKLDRDRYAEQLAAAQTDSSSARSELDAYKNQLASIGNTAGGKDAMILNLTNQNGELQRQLDALNSKYADAVSKVGTGTVLPVALSNELSDFARQNPDLVDFDAARGIVKFKSDVTFSPGSAVVTPKAKEAIARFSQILNSVAASGYELMVAGHTDNTNVVNPATIRAGHKDNWYLSAHRAIAVGEQLIGDRVNPQRLAMTGYADQRPVASNASEAGKAQNRRVEVLILPTQVHAAPAIAEAPAPTRKGAPRSTFNKDGAIPAAARAKPTPVSSFNKDGAMPVSTPRQPIYNK
jgi:chemotaxis protein MotB